MGYPRLIRVASKNSSGVSVYKGHVTLRNTLEIIESFYIVFNILIFNLNFK